MAASSSTINAINSSQSSVKGSALGSAAPAKQLGKDEFLKLLIAQLKNQDPLSPAQGTEFVAQLAQFSTLERLISIDDKTGASSSTGGVSSLASYLGTQVTLNSDTVDVENGNGGAVGFTLPSTASGAKLEIANSQGVVEASVDLGSLQAGDHKVALNGLNLSNGSYKVTLKGVNSLGAPVNSSVSAIGVVTGFTPGDPPSFYMGNRQFSFTDIKKVEIPGQG